MVLLVIKELSKLIKINVSTILSLKIKCGKIILLEIMGGFLYGQHL